MSINDKNNLQTARIAPKSENNGCNNVHDHGQQCLTTRRQLTVDGQRYDYDSLNAVTNQPEAALQLPYCLRALLQPAICNDHSTICSLMTPLASTGQATCLQPTQVLLTAAEKTLIVNDLTAIQLHLSAEGKSAPDPHLCLPIRQLAGDKDDPHVFPLRQQPSNHSNISLSSHCYIGTTTDTAELNAMGIPGWTLSLVDIESAVLDGTLKLPLPDVIGIELNGNYPAGITDAQLLQTLNQQLQHAQISGKFIEFYGEGLAQLTLIERQQIARETFNTGASCSYFPIDQCTLDGLAQLGQTPADLKLLKAWAKAQQLWHEPSQPTPSFSQKFQLNLDSLQPTTTDNDAVQPSNTIATCSTTTDAEQLAAHWPFDAAAPNTSALLTNNQTSGPIHQARILALLGDNISSSQITHASCFSQPANHTAIEPLYPLAMHCMSSTVPAILFAGCNYGQGTDSHWAARGTRLLGIKAVICESFAEPHRHQLAGMGVLPLEFAPGDSWQALALQGDESIELNLPDQLFPYEPVMMVIHRNNDRRELVELTLRLDTGEEISTCSAGGIISRALQRTFQ